MEIWVKGYLVQRLSYHLGQVLGDLVVAAGLGMNQQMGGFSFHLYNCTFQINEYQTNKYGLLSCSGFQSGSLTNLPMGLMIAGRIKEMNTHSGLRLLFTLESSIHGYIRATDFGNGIYRKSSPWVYQASFPLGATGRCAPACWPRVNQPRCSLQVLGLYYGMLEATQWLNLISV